MKDYVVMDDLIPKTQELHRAIFDKGYEQGQKDISEQQSSEELVSKQTVLEILKKNRYDFSISQEGQWAGKILWHENLIKDDACKEIEQLPSAVPVPKKKTGKWVDITNKNGTVIAVRCDCCENSPKHAIRSDFCPNCGAKMSEPQESEKT